MTKRKPGRPPYSMERCVDLLDYAVDDMIDAVRAGDMVAAEHAVRRVFNAATVARNRAHVWAANRGGARGSLP